MRPADSATRDVMARRKNEGPRSGPGLYVQACVVTLALWLGWDTLSQAVRAPSVGTRWLIIRLIMIGLVVAGFVMVRLPRTWKATLTTIVLAWTAIVLAAVLPWRNPAGP